MEPIAIVGHAFRIPPDVEDEPSFWEMLENARNVMTAWPKSRGTLDSFYDSKPGRANMMTAQGGHFLTQHPAVFDAPFFSITSKDAAAMDPQQRWLLETSYHALENAGMPVEKVAGTAIGVFAASMTEDYTRIISKDPDEALPTTGTGNNPSILSNRLSWYYDLRGPSITVNTACSSSMIAMDLACQSLRSGQSCAALVGGSTAILSVETSLHLSSMNFLSPDSLCYSFDARANGYARGEGAIVMVLKRLSDAVQDGDTIRAVIRATGTNQDGHTPGITLPNPQAQEDLVRSVYKSCNLSLKDTRYFEAHGTGTQAGDSAEVNALGRVFRSSRSSDEPLYVGSVKSNIGHLEGISALAGILKCILILEKGLIPPQALFQKINPKINAKFYNIQVPTQCIPWPAPGLRRISINSFGFGGSNGHMILDDAYHTLESRALIAIHHTLLSTHRSNAGTVPVRHPMNEHIAIHARLDNDSKLGNSNVISAEPNTPLYGSIINPSSVKLPRVSPVNEEVSSSPPSSTEASGPEALASQNLAPETSENVSKLRLLTFTAKDEAALRRMLEQYSTYYSNHVSGSAEKVERLAYILARRRSLMPWRSFVVAHKHARSSISFSSPVRASRDNQLAFIFTGQGAQYAGMGKELLEYSVFRKTFEQAGRIFQEQGAMWNVFDVLGDPERIDKPEFSQPLCTALQIALVVLLESWNITSAAVLGHSSGEIAAAYATGMLSLESACRVAYHRGRLAGKLASSSSGAMISANLSDDAVPEYLAELSLSEDVHVACINSPLNTTLSGPESAIDSLKKQLDADRIFAQKLKTGVAYHSPAMQAIAAEYVSSVGKLTRGTRGDASTVMISSVTGSLVTADTVSKVQYWVDNLISPVRFADAVQYLAAVGPKDGHCPQVHEFLEIGPHGALRRPINDTMTQLGKKVRYTSLLSRFDTATKTTLEVAGHLFARGASVDVAAVNQQEKEVVFEDALVDMPAYPFDKTQHYWHESRLSSDWRFRGAAPREVLGVRASDWNPLQPRWRKLLSVEESPWIADHVVGDTVVYPGAGILAMALEAVRQNANPGQKISIFYIKEATFINPIVIRPGLQGRADVVTELHPLRQTYEKTSLRSEVRMYSRHGENGLEIFRGVIHIEYEESHIDEVDGRFEAQAEAERQLQRWKLADAACNKPISKPIFYKWAEATGIRYGDSFQLVEDVRWDGDSLGVSRVDTDAAEIQYPGLVHPAVLDSVCQTVFAAPSKGGTGSIPTVVPYKIHNASIAAAGWQYPETSSIRVATVTRPKKGVMGLDCELTALADDGSPLAYIPRFEMRPMLNNEVQEGAGRDLFHSIEWNPAMSLLSPQQLQELCSTKDLVGDQTVQEGYMQRLGETLEAVIHYHLPQLRAIDWSTVPPHYEKYVSWMDQHVRDQSSCTLQSIEELNARIEELQNERPRWKVITEVARQLPSIMHGDVNPLDLLYSTGFASELYDSICAQVCNKNFKRYIDLLSHQTPSLRILEVGAGTGSFSSKILEALRQREEKTGGISFREYVYTDMSPSFFENAKETFGHFGDRIRFQTLDIERDIPSQGLKEGYFDVVFAGMVLHATSSLSKTLQHLRRALKAGGQLVFIEPTRPDLLHDSLTFGVLPGWWLGVEEFRSTGPLATETQWDQILLHSGFSGNDLILKDYEAESAHAYSMIASTAREASPTSRESEKSGVMYIVAKGNERQLKIANELAANGGIIVSFDELEDEKKAKGDYPVFLVEMGDVLLANITPTAFSLIKRRTQEWKNLLWVTAPSSNSPVAYGGVKDGFLRALRSEYEHKHIVSLSLESLDDAAAYIAQVIDFTFLGKSPEPEYAVKGNKIVTPRLIAEATLNANLNASLHPQLSASSWLPGPPLKIDTSHNGSLETLQFVEDTAYYDPLGPDDVEIEAKAWDLNFRDVFIALGRMEEEPFGDCAGIVTRVGANVLDVKMGDRVVMMCPNAMKMYPRSQKWVSKIPDSMSFEEAAAIFNPALCAYYSLVEVARLQRGEKVLIHAGAGGTGQMAVMVAQMIGAEVFCTAGYKEKKDLLVNQLGVPKDHIFYSRNTTFKKGIMRQTNGYGVDVVLNSLVGEGLRASFECIAPYGRFVELGKADINSRAQLPMECFAKNVSFTAVDIAHLGETRPQLGLRILHTVMELASKGILRSPTPLHRFGLDRLEEAFRYLQSGRNTGRTVLTIEPEAQKRILRRKTWRFDTNATYVIAGGMGGIGRAIMKWMASRGARNLIVPSRSSRSSTTMQEAMEMVSQLRKQGVTISTPRCDVSSAATLRAVLDECGKTMPPVRGCINAAMVLQDAIFDNMSHSQWTQTIQSKVATSWNLHTHLPSDLDFFILLASVAGIVGSPGQSNYAAGCTFQDALCQQRISQGQKALSIDLGVMRTIGIVAETGRLQKNFGESQAMIKIEEDEFFALLDICCDPELSALAPDKSQIVMGIITPADMIAKGEDPIDQLHRPLFANFAQPRDTTQQTGSSASINFAALFDQAVGHEQRAGIVVEALTHKLARALSISPGDVDPEKPLHVFGVDSLVAVELRNWIVKEFAAEIAVFDIMGLPSVAAIGDLVTKLKQTSKPDNQ